MYYYLGPLLTLAALAVKNQKKFFEKIALADKKYFSFLKKMLNGENRYMYPSHLHLVY